MKYDGSTTGNLRRGKTYIVTWPEQKNMGNPQNGEYIKMCLE